MDAFEDEIFDVLGESANASSSSIFSSLNQSTSSKRELAVDSSESENQGILEKQIKLEDNSSARDLSDENDNAEGRGVVRVIALETVSCHHEVAIPHDIEYQPLRKSIVEPAKEYPFTLDPFQKEAILCIDNQQSVLISAHTSAGKTVAAEYAVAMALREKQRVIYTTPIKALSNQKYREFNEEFQDVGLVTGDATINYTASCLIMTTEILRNMLYRGSEITREVGWVIFDEIHYMRDPERGVVWEETLILLPDNVRFVFLSATIPNARQFAEWVAHVHHQPCHVVYTEYRPVPLQHYLYPADSQGIHLIVDELGVFREDNFGLAISVLANNSSDSADKKEGGEGKRLSFRDQTEKKNDSCTNIINMLWQKDMAPVIVFSFSKKECEQYGMKLAKDNNYTTDAEKTLIDEVFENAIGVLSEEDRKLPQIMHIILILRKGIGIHHGGLLPIIKEVIEILFAEGLLKVLFATETFAMGLNMPAKTVMFTSCRKFDGKNNRFITSGEYIQMSGRAGRRGLDDKGFVILMIDEKVSPEVTKNVMQGQPDCLNSAFHLTYNMVLNLLRVEGINPEYMLERSFCHYQNQSNAPRIKEELALLEKSLKKIKIENESSIASYYDLRKKLDQRSEELTSIINAPELVLPFLNPGRLIKVKAGDSERDWGAVLNHRQSMKKNVRRVYVDVLVPPKVKMEFTYEPEVISVSSDEIVRISSVRLNNVPHNLQSTDNQKAVLKMIDEVVQRHPKGVPLLRPVEDMKISDARFYDVVKKIEEDERKLFDHPLFESPLLDNLYDQYDEKAKLANAIENKKSELSKVMSSLHMADLKNRKRVLKRLNYCTTSDVVEMKGRVACELSCGEELLMTELIFNGVFKDLDVPQCVALLSCFVCDEKSSKATSQMETLTGPLRLMQSLARKVARVSKECNIDIDEDSYVEKFKPFLMDVCYSWCTGSPFADICQMTDIFEGSIVRAMRRLEEILRQFVQASKTIGNEELENKFMEAIKTIKRDIVFAASLYL